MEAGRIFEELGRQSLNVLEKTISRNLDAASESSSNTYSLIYDTSINTFIQLLCHEVKHLRLLLLKCLFVKDDVKVFFKND